MTIEYFEKLEEPRRSIAYALHEKVAKAGPHLVQKTLWGFPSFVGNRNVVSIPASGRAKDAHVKLQFFFGAHLPNPEGLIEGTGKNLRHIKVFAREEADSPDVAAAIQAAIELDREPG